MSEITIKINGNEHLVDSSLNLLQALKLHGYDIPHFCYHESLGVNGNCRMCLIEIAGQKRPQIACDTPLKEGMEVFTDSEKTRAVQRNIMELELINHPLDCPVCDQAGECYLQDYYMSYDKSKSRMQKDEKVAKYKKQDFGAGVVHDAERCVLCTRCVRFTKKITKTGELGLTRRGAKAQISLFDNRPLTNAYAQCVVDICPVGAMTSKDFRFKERVWFLKSIDTICLGCAKGCNIHAEYAKNKYEPLSIYRFKPRVNEAVNGYFMCDKGRDSYKEYPLQRNDENSLKEIATLRDALGAFKEKNDISLQLLISPNLSVEEAAALDKLASFYNASISSYHVIGRGDDFLISQEKGANIKGLELLGIKMHPSQEAALDALDKRGFVLFVDVDIERTLEEFIHFAIISSKGATSKEAIANLRCANYLQHFGSYINEDGILQVVERLPKDIDAPIIFNINDLVALLSDNKLPHSIHEIRGELAKKYIKLAPLAKIRPKRSQKERMDRDASDGVLTNTQSYLIEEALLNMAKEIDRQEGRQNQSMGVKA